ncbi:MAG: hypothetical protein KAS07_00525 [Candidatus Pacebacteria bacterium]|nr:hypothetical protein [Candidatus Paceibacterota bacterium]
MSIKKRAQDFLQQHTVEAININGEIDLYGTIATLIKLNKDYGLATAVLKELKEKDPSGAKLYDSIVEHIRSDRYDPAVKELDRLQLIENKKKRLKNVLFSTK